MESLRNPLLQILHFNKKLTSHASKLRSCEPSSDGPFCCDRPSQCEAGNEVWNNRKTFICRSVVKNRWNVWWCNLRSFWPLLLLTFQHTIRLCDQFYIDYCTQKMQIEDLCSHWKWGIRLYIAGLVSRRSLKNTLHTNRLNSVATNLWLINIRPVFWKSFPPQSIQCSMSHVWKWRFTLVDCRS